MLGAQQKAVFLQWLSDVNSTVTWKFVVSSVPMTSLWDSGLSSDDTYVTTSTRVSALRPPVDAGYPCVLAVTNARSWAAFLHERDQLFDVMQYINKSVLTVC